MEQRAWIGTGETTFLPGEIDRTPRFSLLTREHLWAIMTMYRWGGPGIKTPRLDHTNLLSLVGPACYYCGQDWNPKVADQLCPGGLT